MTSMRSSPLNLKSASALRWVRGIALALLVGAVVALMIPWFGNRSESAFAVAVDQALADRRMDKADRLVRDRLTKQPDSAAAHFAFARLEYGRKRLNEAFDAARKARTLGYPPEPIDRLEGLVLAEAGRSAEAEPILMAILEKSGGKDLEVAEALAKIFLTTYKLSLASIVLNRWIEVAPGDAKPYLWLTEIDKRTEVDSSQTIAHYRAALSRDETLDAAWLGLAETLLSGKQTVEAAKAFAEYLARKPDDPAGHLGAAKAARDLGDEAAVSLHLAEALKAAPDLPAALRESAALELRRGNATSALAMLDRALKLEPDSESLYLRSLALTRLGRATEARETQEKAATLRREETELLDIQSKLVRDPNNLPLRGRIARWMLDHGRDDEAVRWAKLILERNPTDSSMNTLLAAYHTKRGEAGLANFYRTQAGEKK